MVPSSPMSRDELPGFCWSASSFWMTDRSLGPLESQLTSPFSVSFGYPEFQIFTTAKR